LERRGGDSWTVVIILIRRPTPPLIQAPRLAPSARRDDIEGFAHNAQRARTAHQLGRQRRQSIKSTVRPAVFDGYILPLDIAGFI